MNKKGLVGKLLLLFVFAVIGGAFFVNSFFSDYATPARLHIESGSVFVNDEQIRADVFLDVGDVVETKDGLATIILHDSAIVSLRSNTRISVDDLRKQHPVLTQSSGQSWNKFVSLAGVESYSIKTGSSVASVRGTAFKLFSDKIVGLEGNVKYTAGGKSFDVGAMSVVESKNSGVFQRKAGAGDLDGVYDDVKRSIAELKKVRADELKRHGALVAIFKRSLDLDDAKIESGFDSADAGELDVDELLERAPFKTASVVKIAKLTKEIQQMNSLLRELKK